MAQPIFTCNNSNSFIESLRDQLKEIPKYQISLLTSPAKIKCQWLHSEWQSGFDRLAKKIQTFFPSRDELLFETANLQKVNDVFNQIRGKYDLWQETRETADWVEVTTPALPFDWVDRHIEVLYGKRVNFELPNELCGIVLWKTPNTEKFQLLEGNTRFSAWHRSKKTDAIAATLFIGRTSDRIDPKNVVEIDGQPV